MADFWEIMGFFANKIGLWGFSFANPILFGKNPIILKILRIFQKLAIFANENRKLWGFYLQKPHNSKFQIMGFFQIKTP